MAEAEELGLAELQLLPKMSPTMEAGPARFAAAGEGWWVHEGLLGCGAHEGVGEGLGAVAAAGLVFWSLRGLLALRVEDPIPKSNW